MDLQPTFATQASNNNNDDTMQVANLDIRSRLMALLLKRFPNFSSSAKKRLLCITYLMFFTWQVIGLILYSIRAFEATFSAKHASFQTTDIEMFSHSAQLELLWVISQMLNAGVVILALKKVPSFLGYSTILRSLVRLPSFWSLMSLYGMCNIGYFAIIALKNDSPMEIALILAFLFAGAAHVFLIGFLSFTQINASRRKSLKLCAFFKVNIFISFMSFFVEFVIGTFQFALDIYGIDDDHNEISSDFMSLIGEIRRFTAIVFAYRIYIFYWEKMFVDNRNILCHHDFLDDARQVSYNDDVQSTSTIVTN